MVPLAGRALIQWQADTARRLGIEDIWVVGGYRQNAIDAGMVTSRFNAEFTTTNMVYSLWCARSALQGDVLISYGDIVCERCVLAAAATGRGPISVAIDKGWLPYWQRRFTDPLSDAESLKMDDEGRITSIGRPVTRLEEIQGQYIGLVRLDNDGCRIVLDAMESRREADSARFAGMYMTDLLQEIAETTRQVWAVPVFRGWVEIDSPSDLEIAEALARPAGPKMRFADSVEPGSTHTH